MTAAALPWPEEEIVQVLRENPAGLREELIWQTIPIPARFMLRGRGKGRLRRPDRPIPKFCDALVNLTSAGTITDDGRGWWRLRRSSGPRAARRRVAEGLRV